MEWLQCPKNTPRDPPDWGGWDRRRSPISDIYSKGLQHIPPDSKFYSIITAPG